MALGPCRMGIPPVKANNVLGDGLAPCAPGAPHRQNAHVRVAALRRQIREAPCYHCAADRTNAAAARLIIACCRSSSMDDNGAMAVEVQNAENDACPECGGPPVNGLSCWEQLGAIFVGMARPGLAGAALPDGRFLQLAAPGTVHGYSQHWLARAFHRVSRPGNGGGRSPPGCGAAHGRECESAQARSRAPTRVAPLVDDNCRRVHAGTAGGRRRTGQGVGSHYPHGIDGVNRLEARQTCCHGLTFLDSTRIRRMFSRYYDA